MCTRRRFDEASTWRLVGRRESAGGLTSRAVCYDPPNEHTSEGGRDDRGVPYHAESTLSSAQVLKFTKKQPRGHTDFHRNKKAHIGPDKFTKNTAPVYFHVNAAPGPDRMHEFSQTLEEQHRISHNQIWAAPPANSSNDSLGRVYGGVGCRPGCSTRQSYGEVWGDVGRCGEVWGDIAARLLHL